MRKAVDEEFVPDYTPSVGCDFKVIEAADQKIKLQLWDTPGREIFRSIKRAFYRGAHIIVYVFDVTNKPSFTELTDYWMEQATTFGDPSINPLLLLIGTKNDLPGRQVSMEEAEELAARLNMMCLDYSSATSSSKQLVEKLVEVSAKYKLLNNL